MPKVSIIIPSYNHSNFLIDRLESISRQTYSDWEAIIIDDKSNDDSVEIIKKFLKENPIFNVKHFIVNDENSGSGYKSWKKGIELATTEFIWIAETDDYSDVKFLEEMVLSMESNDAVLSFCDSIYVNKDKKILYDSRNRTSNLGVSTDESKMFKGSVYIDNMPFNTYITNGSAVVFRKPQYNVPDEIFIHKQCSDIFLWSYLLRENSFIFVCKNLNFFRRHENSTSHIIQSKNLQSVYHENAYYLNYFDQLDKSDIFIKHYIKYYVYNNKFDFLNISSLLKIGGKRTVIRYFWLLSVDLIKKIKLKLWNSNL